MHDNKLFRFASLLILAGILSVLTVSNNADADTYYIEINANGYDPDYLEIYAEDEVVWQNEDTQTHTVTADDGEFDSGDILPGNEWSYQFREDQEGSNPYSDERSDATGEIVVSVSGSGDVNEWFYPATSATRVSYETNDDDYDGADENVTFKGAYNGIDPDTDCSCDVRVLVEIFIYNNETQELVATVREEATINRVNIQNIRLTWITDETGNFDANATLLDMDHNDKLEDYLWMYNISLTAPGEGPGVSINVDSMVWNGTGDGIFDDIRFYAHIDEDPVDNLTVTMYLWTTGPTGAQRLQTHQGQTNSDGFLDFNNVGANAICESDGTCNYEWVTDFESDAEKPPLIACSEDMSSELGGHTCDILINTQALTTNQTGNEFGDWDEDGEFDDLAVVMYNPEGNCQSTGYVNVYDADGNLYRSGDTDNNSAMTYSYYGYLETNCPYYYNAPEPAFYVYDLPEGNYTFEAYLDDELVHDGEVRSPGSSKHPTWGDNDETFYQYHYYDSENGQYHKVWYSTSDDNRDGGEENITFDYNPNTECKCEVNIRVEGKAYYNTTGEREETAAYTFSADYVIFEDEYETIKQSWITPENSTYDFRFQLLDLDNPVDGEPQLEETYWLRSITAGDAYHDDEYFADNINYVKWAKNDYTTYGEFPFDWESGAVNIEMCVDLWHYETEWNIYIVAEDDYYYVYENNGTQKNKEFSEAYECTLDIETLSTGDYEIHIWDDFGDGGIDGKVRALGHGHKTEDRDDNGAADRIEFYYDPNTHLEDTYVDIKVQMLVLDNDKEETEDNATIDEILNEIQVYENDRDMFDWDWNVTNSSNYTFKLRLWDMDSDDGDDSDYIAHEYVVDIALYAEGDEPPKPDDNEWYYPSGSETAISWETSDEDDDGSDDSIRIFSIDPDTSCSCDVDIRIEVDVYASGTGLDGDTLAVFADDFVISGAVFDDFQVCWSSDEIAQSMDFHVKLLDLDHNEKLEDERWINGTSLESNDGDDIECASSGGSNPSDEWFEDFNVNDSTDCIFDPSDEDDDGQDDTMLMICDVDTNSANQMEVEVRFYVYNGSGYLIDQWTIYQYIAGEDLEEIRETWNPSEEQDDANDDDEYDFYLNVYDDQGNFEDSDYLSNIELHAPNNDPPIVNGVVYCLEEHKRDCDEEEYQSPSNLSTVDELHFEADVTDEHPDDLEFTWDFGDNTTANYVGDFEAKHSYSEEGCFYINLYVEDKFGENVTYHMDSDIDDGEDDWDCFDIGAPKPTIGELFGNEAPYEGSTQWYEVEASDPTGSDLIYTWDFGDGSEIEVYEGSTDGERVSHIFIDDGDYVLNVTVTNQANQSAYKTLNILVNNMIPTILDVTITVNDLESDMAIVGQTMTFTAEAFDPGVNDTLTYLWNFGVDCGTPVCTAEGSTVTHAYAESNGYVVSLKVYDDSADECILGGNCREWGAIVTILPINFDIESLSFPSTATMSEDIAFSSILSGDVNPNDLIFDWDFGDGNTATGQQVTHAYETSGSYFVTLTVSDPSSGASVTKNQGIVINAPSSIPEDDTEGGGFELPIDATTLIAISVGLVVLAVVGAFVMTRRGRDDEDTFSTDDFSGDFSFSTSDTSPDSLAGLSGMGLHSSPTKPTPAAPAAPTKPTPAAGVIVQCPSCQTKLKVTDPSRPITIACPSCQTKLKLQ